MVALQRREGDPVRQVSLNSGREMNQLLWDGLPCHVGKLLAPPPPVRQESRQCEMIVRSDFRSLRRFLNQKCSNFELHSVISFWRGH